MSHHACDPTFIPPLVNELRRALDGFLFRHRGDVERRDGMEHLVIEQIEIVRGPSPRGGIAYIVAVDHVEQLHMRLIDGDLRVHHGTPSGWLVKLAAAALSSVDSVIRHEEEDRVRRAYAAKARTDARLSASQIGLRLLAMVHVCGWLAPGSKDVLVHAIGRWIVTATRDTKRGRVTITVTDGPICLMRLTATPGVREWDVDVTNRARGAWASELLAACPLRVGPPACDPALSWWPQRSRRRVARQALAGFRWTFDSESDGNS